MSNIEVSAFDHIRPYNDDEIHTVIDRLLMDDEFISAVANLRMKRKHKVLEKVLYPIVRNRMRKRTKHIYSVRDVQQLVKQYLDRMLSLSCSALTLSGLEALDQQLPYMFIGNHRDIVLDPALINYILFTNGFDTARVAIGDNLLSKSFVSELMRLNKSFVVQRSAKGPREMLTAYQNLSAYIRHCIQEDQSSVWIAQAEGRAKDGLDQTQPAVIKMLAMARDKQLENFSDYMQTLRILPVAISYEYDPCDEAKARELYEIENKGSYTKSEHEDVVTIAKGIKGQKGHIHIAFGSLLKGTYENPDELAKAVDDQIIENYVLHPTNFFAFHALSGFYPKLPCRNRLIEFDIADYSRAEAIFKIRIEKLPDELKPYVLQAYANPVKQKLA